MSDRILVFQLMIALEWFYTTIIHTLSLGDALQVAPDGEVICPKAEPISEDVKYRLFNLDVAGADLHLCESDGSITRLQSAGLDLETCTLHSGDETMGLSWQLQSLTVTGLSPNPQEPTLQLQVALLDFSHLQGNMAMREPLESVPKRQLDFLMAADQKTRRLWFLWREDISAVCGCCGGCLFMENSISRMPVLPRSQSAVYCAQFFPLTSIPRHLALQGVNQALAASSISAVECMWSLHRGLTQHYQARYQDKPLPFHSFPPPAVFSQQHNQEERSSSKVGSYSDDIYMSARSSLTSLLAEDCKSSVSDVNLEAVEEALTRKTKHMRKPSNLSVDFRAGGVDQVDSEQPSSSLHSEFQGLSSSHFLHTVTLKIPCSVSEPPADGADRHAPAASNTERSQFKVHHRQSASDTSFLVRGPTPDAAHPPPNPFHLYIPCLTQECAGNWPVITQKGTVHTLERKRRVTVKEAVSDEGKTADQAKFFLSIQVNGSNTFLLSPSVLNIITR